MSHPYLRAATLSRGFRALVCGFGILLAGCAFAQVSASWNINAAGNWSDTTKWSGGIAPGATSGTSNGDTADFGFTLTAGRVVTIDNGRNIGTILFSSTGVGGYTLSGGSVTTPFDLLLSNGGLIRSTSTSGSHTDTIAAYNNISIQGDGGSATYSADATSSIMALFSTKGNSTAGNTTTLYLTGTNTGANSIGGTNASISDGAAGGKLAIVKNGTGTWTINASVGATYSGGTTINAGALKLAAGSNALLGTGTLTLNGGELWLAHAAGRNQGRATIVTADSTITSDRSSAGAGLTHGQASLSIGANTLTIRAGTNVTSDTAGYTFTGLTTLTGNATLHVVNGTSAVTLLTLGGGMNTNGYTASFTGDGQAVVNGEVSGTGGITQNGTGTLTLNGTNTYSGDTRVNSGTLVLGSSNALAGSAYDTSSTGTLTLFTGTNNLGGLKSSGNFANGGNAISVGGGNGNHSYGGDLSGAGALAKIGTGTQTLTGANSYTGETSISGGVLAVAGSGSINSSSGVVIQSGGHLKYNSATALTAGVTMSGVEDRAVLSGVGVIAAPLSTASLQNVIAPGNSVGLLSFTGNQTWNSFTYDWEVSNYAGSTAGVDFDGIAVDGALSLSGLAGSYQLRLISLGAGDFFESGVTTGQWTLITASSGINDFDAAAWTIDFSGLTTAESLGGAFTLGVQGNDLVLSYAPIPEPSTTALILGVSVIGLALWVRRRRHV